MRRILLVAAAAVIGILGFAFAASIAGAGGNDPPNQGDPDKILTVGSGYVCSGTLLWLDKVEVGGDTHTISFSAPGPIVKVTIKSGEKADLVSASFAADYLSGTITISQGVSNYVVWYCQDGGTTSTETTGTTETFEPPTVPAAPTAKPKPAAKPAAPAAAAAGAEQSVFQPPALAYTP